MAKELPGVRRVVTAHDRDGKSVFVEDGPANFTTLTTRPGFRHFHIWATGSLPVPADDPDRSAEVSGILPPVGGSVLHILDIPPEPDDPAERAKAYAARRESARAHMAHPPPACAIFRTVRTWACTKPIPSTTRSCSLAKSTPCSTRKSGCSKRATC